jgi:glutaredoxin
VRYFALLILLGGVFAWQHQGDLRLAWQKAQPGYQPPPVVLLATGWCGYCKKMREYFAEQNIAYTEYDVEQDAKGQQWYEELGADGVPVVLVGAQVIYGYDPDGVSAALAVQ